MCDFLTRKEDKTPLHVQYLEARIDAEKHVCDALFATLMESLANPSFAKLDKARSLYGQLILARTQNQYTDSIIDAAHDIINESAARKDHKHE